MRMNPGREYPACELGNSFRMKHGPLRHNRGPVFRLLAAVTIYRRNHPYEEAGTHLVARLFLFFNLDSC